ncbi:MAG: hypothetical protein Mars2KO_01790 [Maribacter sp.]
MVWFVITENEINLLQSATNYLNDPETIILYRPSTLLLGIMSENGTLSGLLKIRYVAVTLS